MEENVSSSSVASILFLPSEIVAEILLCPSLSVPDLCRVRQVCRPFHSIVSRLWTKVATSRWKGWGSISGSTHQEWYELCCQRFRCESQLTSTLDHLMRRCFKIDFTDEDELRTFSDLLKRGSFSHDILLLVLSEMLETSYKSANLTHQFYALYGKEYLIRQELVKEWRELLTLPKHEQTMETGAVLLAQWMRPCHCSDASAISKQLDSIADSVAVQLLGPPKDTTEGEDEDVKRQRQSPAVEMVKGRFPVDSVLFAINTVLYGRLGYREAGEAYYELENSYIDMVLERKRGIPITLCVVYEAVARRLGVRLVPVNFPQHFVLRLPPANDGDTTLSPSDPVIIDAYNRGRRLSLDQLMERVSLYLSRTSDPPSLSVIKPAAAVDVYARLLNNVAYVAERTSIVRIFHEPTAQWLPIPLLSLLYLRLELAPLAEQFTILGRGRKTISMCLQLNYNIHQVYDLVTSPLFWSIGQRYALETVDPILQKRELLQSHPVKPKLRPTITDVKYSVGTITKHKLYDYRCTIYGWDDRCEMSEAWIRQMNVDRHPPGRNQPFYNVLAHDGSNRYAAQANLMDCPAEELGPIPHWEIGKYFSHFTGDRYTPNTALREAYPDDL